MKSKSVYTTPEVKGTYVLQTMKHKGGLHPDVQKIEQELKEKKQREEEEHRRALEFARQLELAREEAYKNGKLSAEQEFKKEIEELKNQCASVAKSFLDAVKHLTDKREKILAESESEIVRFVLAVSHKVIGYEIDKNGTNLIRQVVKDALAHATEKKVVAVRLSPDDVIKMNALEEMKFVDQNVRILEDNTITSGGCVVETDFGSIDCQIETRWEAIEKTVLGDRGNADMH